MTSSDNDSDSDSEIDAEVQAFMNSIEPTQQSKPKKQNEIIDGIEHLRWYNPVPGFYETDKNGPVPILLSGLGGFGLTEDAMKRYEQLRLEKYKQKMPSHWTDDLHDNPESRRDPLMIELFLEMGDDFGDATINWIPRNVYAKNTWRIDGTDDRNGCFVEDIAYDEHKADKMCECDEKIRNLQTHLDNNGGPVIEINRMELQSIMELMTHLNK
jgi:hypothetical protein